MRTLILLVCLLSAGGYAQERYPFHIPEQSASTALNLFAVQAEQLVLFPFKRVKGITANSLEGQYTVPEAIEILLEGTGLQPLFSKKNVLTIVIESDKTLAEEEGMKDQKKKGRGIAGAVLALFGGAAATGENNTAWANGVLEEITVTAQKREESLQDVPLAVTAFSAELLREEDIANMDDVAQRTPGLSFHAFAPGQPEISIRGISTKEDGPAANDSTVVSIDDVYVAARIAQVFDIYDLDRIEVLRGPQGTLYGRNSIAGSINFVTSRPTEDLNIRVEQTFGRFDQIDTRALISGRISDSLLGKFSVSRRKRDGFVDQYTLTPVRKKTGEHQDVDRFSWRGQLLWEGGEDFEAILTIDGEINDDKGTPREPNLGSVAPINASIGGQSLYDTFPVISEGKNDREVFGVSLKMTYDMDWAELTSITAYRQADLDWEMDSFGLPPTVFGGDTGNYTREETTQLTQEFRLNGDSDRLKWVTGIFITSESDHRIEDLDFRALTLFESSDQDADIFGWAVYGQATWALTDQLNLTAGLRYSYEEKENFVSGSATAEPGSSGQGIIDGFGGIVTTTFPATRAEADWDSVDYRIGLDYAVNEDVMIYGMLSTGFKSGGFTGFPRLAASSQRPFDPEKAINFEAGIKSQWLNNSLQLNLTAFKTDYQDLQVTSFRLTPQVPVFGEFLTENADSADIEGVEFESVWAPADWLTLTAWYAYLDATYEDFGGTTPLPSGDPIDFSGNTLREAPEHTGGGSIKLTHTMASGGVISAKVSGRYQDEVFFDPQNEASAAVAESFSVFDARVAYLSPDEQWEVALWSKNLTDEEYWTHSASTGGGVRASSIVAPPQTYGLTVTWFYNNQ